MTTTMLPVRNVPERDRASLRDGRLARGGVVLGFLLLAVALDQLSKQWAMQALADGRQIQLVPTIRLELFFNPGVAFGIGAEVGAPLVIGLIVLVGALVAWLCLRVIRRAPLTGTVMLAIAAGGGIGNLLDRILRADHGPLTGRVVDFIAVDWFAVFNIADIFTTCGIALWALTQLHAPSHRETQRLGNSRATKP
jgi:signal peptidase II